MRFLLASCALVANEIPLMGSTITVRGIDPSTKSWLRRQARHDDISMEEFVRRLIRDSRKRAEKRPKPSEVFRRLFGPEHGVEVPLDSRYGYRPLELS